MTIEVQRAEERYTGGGTGIESRYAFSFGDHYDPDNIHFGPLLACNEERLAPGAGFAEHHHRDTEIVTWVVEGALEHRDGTGGHAVLGPGTVGCLSAGSGVVHTERNAGETPVRFVQMWLRPDVFAAPPAHARWTVPPRLRHAVLAAGERSAAAAVRLRRRDAALHLLRADRLAGAPPQRPAALSRPLPALPVAPFVYIHVVYGEISLSASDGSQRRLRPGDAARIHNHHPLSANAGPSGAEVLLWEAGSDLSLG